MFKSSTGIRNALLAELKTQMDGFKIYIYDDTASEPSSPDDAVPGTSVLLVTISESGGATGLTFAAPSSGIMLKEPTETWLGTIANSGTALWYRAARTTDTSSSTTEMRLQGSVGTLNADLLVASTSFIATQEQRVDYYSVGLPAS